MRIAGHHRWLTLTCVLLVVSAALGQTAPVWEETLESVFREGLREDLLPGNGLGSIKATDPDGDQITYSTDSDFLNVDERSGRVTVKTELDRETKPVFTVEFTATDTEDNTVTTRHTVYVLDVNDNSPQFLQRPYSATVKEDESVGTTVFRGIRIQDADLEKNAEVTLSCYSPPESEENIDAEEAASACDMFELHQKRGEGAGQYTGQVVLKKSLDYEKKRQYILTAMATDRGEGSTQMSSVVNIVIVVEDVQDMQPTFLSQRLSLSVFENTPAGNSVGDLEARDQDEGNPNPLLLRIVSDPSNFFTLSTPTEKNGVYTSVIRSTGNIDREPERDSYEITVEAVELVNGQETEAKTTMTIMVLVRDRNDNRPRFNQDNYVVTIDEGLARDTQVANLDMVVSDADLDDNAFFELEIIDDENEVFNLSPTSGTKQVAVSLVVNEPRFLDYERPEYRRQVFKVVARETQTSDQRSSTATVTINLRDVNDHSPKFQHREYSAHIREDRRPPVLVKTITATDEDSGSLGSVTYRLIGQGNEFFAVDRNSGRITLEQGLDFETQSYFDLTFEATDGGGRSSSVPFRVNVLDFNDQGPAFEVDQYQTFAAESSRELTPNVTVKAFDEETDFGITYTIIAGNTDDNAFTIDPDTGYLSLRRRVNYDETSGRGFFELTVQASDNDRPAQTGIVIVTVTIRDENDHTPEFGNAIYRGTVTETTKPGVSVVTVLAKDLDAGQNGQVNYFIQSGAKDNFQVDFNDGVIRVADGANLDIERFGNQYRMIVYAVDQGGPALTGTAQVFITVTDANNKLPEFNQNLYLISIMETISVDTPIRTVQAVDPDSGSSIQYSIPYASIEAKDRNGNPVTSQANFDYKAAFRVDPSGGQIRVNSTLNRDAAAEISFIVEASDLNADDPAPQIGTASVIITIRSPDGDEDIDFNPPTDSGSPTYSVTVPEESSINKEIFLVAADDPVTGNRISDFKKIDSTDPGNYFRVERNTGKIILLRNLDYEDPSIPSHSLDFELIAYTSPPDVIRSATATIIVNIQDMNDHSPEFDEDSYTFDISENTRFPTQFGTVTATDEDSNGFGSVTYTLSGQGTEYFGIDPDTGKVFVKEGVVLDREATGTYTMLVTATDGSGGDGPSRSTSVPLTVVLEDENDNAPRFMKPSYDFSILETSDKQVSLGQVHAEDEDQGMNGEVDYSIVSSDATDLFYIDTVTGILRTLKPLAGNARPSPYLLTVRGKDRGNPSLSSETTVRVFVETLQGNDGQPQFIFPDEDGAVINFPEETVLGTNVTQIKAVDRDGQRLTYSFFSNSNDDDSSYFNIDPQTGVITVKKNLDRELKGQYELIVVVRDNGFPPQENLRRVIVNLTDIDDSSPSFYDCPDPLLANPQIGHVDEGLAPPVMVTRVKACDLDQPPNNVVYYFIVDGNSPLQKGPSQEDETPFMIEKSTGQILTNVVLDREYLDKYLLKVKVSSSPVLEADNDSRTRRATDQVEKDTIGVLIYVDDVDDNGPSFEGYANDEFVAGVSATARHGTEICKIIATDKDDNVYTVIRYSLSKIQYVGSDSSQSLTPYAFRIDPITGQVYTNKTSFIKFVDGYFQMNVIATDTQDRKAEIELFVYVVRATQRLRLIFRSPPSVVKDIYQDLFSEMDNQFGGIDFNYDFMRHHVEEDATADFDWTDLCFHMVRDNKVMNSDVALETIDEALESDSTDFHDLLARYDVKEVGICEVKMTTKKWDDYFWLWWILIALAIFIFILALLLICCICCCWPRYKQHVLGGKPNYVVLNSVPVASAGGIGSTLSTRYPDYEWQEEVVKMY